LVEVLARDEETSVLFRLDDGHLYVIMPLSRK
jgi:hypothetical protein